MTQTLAYVYLHVVFSTKNREPLIDVAIENELHRYICGIAREQSCQVLAISGMPDHVHILMRVTMAKPVADIMKNIKAFSTGWIKRKGYDDFGWQSGYGAFSVSHSLLPTVKRYVLAQKEHHKSQLLTEELSQFASICGEQWHFG